MSARSVAVRFERLRRSISPAKKLAPSQIAGALFRSLKRSISPVKKPAPSPIAGALLGRGGPVRRLRIACASPACRRPLMPLYTCESIEQRRPRATAAARQRGGIEPLRVSMPLELKSSPHASPTHPGNLMLCADRQSCAQEATKY